MIMFNEVTKNIKKINILNNLTFEIKNNKTYVIYGKNGSGKSTTIKLMLNILKLNKNDSGEIYNDFEKINYFPEKFLLPPFISSYDFLKTYLEGLCSDDLILDYMNKYNVYNKKICRLSKGMQQKLILIKTLIEDANLYVFDEPLNGLDDESRGVFLNDLYELKNKNKTIIIVTHEKEFFEDLYDELICLGENDEEY